MFYQIGVRYVAIASLSRGVINGRITNRIVSWTDFRCELLAPVVRHSFILEWTTSLDTSSSTLFVCRGREDCVQRDLSPTSGYTGISARRRYQFWERDLSPTFKRISDRICAASINLVNHKLIVISAYAPTLEVREANPELRELFYNQLDSTVSRDS